MSEDARGSSRLHVVLLLSTLAVFSWSGVRPVDRPTWTLEVAPVVIALVLLTATYRRFRWSDLCYGLIWFHAIILMVGGHWTYAKMPLFNWLRDAFHLQRNHYDRVGHLVQGIVPVIVVRELLLRTSPLRCGHWLFALCVMSTLGCSALFELFEWLVAIILEQGADQYLATQGDPWDTQWDMFLALVGAIGSLLVFGRWHDRGIAKVESAATRAGIR